MDGPYHPFRLHLPFPQTGDIGATLVLASDVGAGEEPPAEPYLEQPLFRGCLGAEGAGCY
ncbi:hypothetical protein BH11ARM2_BH11ARM2_08330 [soil metagenome]